MHTYVRVYRHLHMYGVKALTLSIARNTRKHDGRPRFPNGSLLPRVTHYAQIIGMPAFPRCGRQSGDCTTYRRSLNLTGGNNNLCTAAPRRNAKHRPMLAMTS